MKCFESPSPNISGNDYILNKKSKNMYNHIKKKANSLSNGNDIKLSSFGSFLIKRKKSRMGRNPKTKIEAVISERNVVIFRPSMQLKNKINTDQ